MKNVAITHCPVNVGTEMEALAKALVAGSSISNPGAAPGEGFALRPESLDEAPYGQEGSDNNAWEAGAREEEDPHATENLAAGEGDDANNGGWSGLNPHTTAIRSPKDGTPPRQQMAKADSDFRIVDELDLIDEWAPVLSRQLENLQPPARLSKAESRIIVANRFPHLSSEQINDIIEHASTPRERHQ